MKSNYPRPDGAVSGKNKPNLLPYTLGLGLVTLAMSSLDMVINFLANPNNSSLSELRTGLAAICTLLVVSFGVILLWKCSKWTVREKAKLVTVTASGTWAIVCVVSLAINSPRLPLREIAPMFGMALVVLFAVLAVSSMAIWTIAAVTRWLGSQFRLQAVEVAHTDSSLRLDSSTQLITTEPEVVRTNA